MIRCTMNPRTQRRSKMQFATRSEDTGYIPDDIDRLEDMLEHLSAQHHIKVVVGHRYRGRIAHVINRPVTLVVAELLRGEGRKVLRLVGAMREELPIGAIAGSHVEHR